jgi:UDP-N-acetylglucosamine acyltransferase
MAGAHVGHNARLGNQVILANGAMIGGHAIIGDRVFLSGSCLVHQFVRVGELAMMQGGAGLSQDLPPFTMVREVNVLSGLNVVGLRRAGFTADDRKRLKRLYHLLFRSGSRLQEALAQAESEFNGAAEKRLIEFMRGGTRGFCSDRGRPSATTDEEEAG